jgi:hypothetical protein
MLMYVSGLHLGMHTGCVCANLECLAPALPTWLMLLIILLVAGCRVCPVPTKQHELSEQQLPPLTCAAGAAAVSASSPDGGPRHLASNRDGLQRCLWRLSVSIMYVTLNKLQNKQLSLSPATPQDLSHDVCGGDCMHVAYSVDTPANMSDHTHFRMSACICMMCRQQVAPRRHQPTLASSSAGG